MENVKTTNQSIINTKEDCPFCNLDSKRELILESEFAFAIFDNYPVSNGHTLIIPKIHCSNYFQISFSYQSDCWMMINKVKDELQKRFNPDGFNIGININEEAGQTIPHCHIHIIPRYRGDVAQPRGGIRGVIPSKKNY